jgi:hypothetical protein
MTSSPDESVSTDTTTTEYVPRWTRAFVGLFLTAFVLCGLLGIEACPLSGFRLFSHLRTADRTAFVVVTVDDHGLETPIPFGRLPAAYRGSGFVARDLPSLSSEERLSTCRVWIDVAERELGRDVAEIRIYRLDITVLPRTGERAASRPARSLVYDCSTGGSVAPA